MSKKLLLVGNKAKIEPLGLFYLTSVALQENWQVKIFLIDENEEEFIQLIQQYKPQIVGFTVYVGKHKKIFQLASKIKKLDSTITIVFGGPFTTCFPERCLEYADYVVVGCGIESFRKILKQEVVDSILYGSIKEELPIADRSVFYNLYPNFMSSRIKSILGSTGCPFACTYCYNSMSKELFPLHLRPVSIVLEEIRKLLIISPETRFLFFQDDVFGFNLDWLTKFSKGYEKIKIPFHIQTRIEFLDPKKDSSKKRLDLLREAGCTGITFAIETSDPIGRTEILNRSMSTNLIFDVMEILKKYKLKVRTEQMLGLPYGATEKKTLVGLDNDLEILKLNIQLFKEFQLPTIAWASILVPYKGTKIWDYCNKYGFYSEQNDDVPETFFEQSILQFPKSWYGPSLKSNTKDIWMDSEELNKYKEQMKFLQEYFHLFSILPNGHKLAETMLNNNVEIGSLQTELKYHLYDSELYGIY